MHNKHFTLTIFCGSTKLTHESPTIFGIVNALRDVALKCPEYAPVLDRTTMDEYIEDLVLLKNGAPGTCITNDSPFIRIRIEDDELIPPTLPDCSTGKEVVHG